MKKYKIIELPEMVGKTLEEVKNYLEKTYPNQLPTEKDRDYLYEHQDEFKEWETEGWAWYYFFGSLVHNSDGHFFVPCAGWDGSGWGRAASWLSSSWSADYRVVLLEISYDYCQCKRCQVCNKIIKI